MKPRQTIDLAPTTRRMPEPIKPLIEEYLNLIEEQLPSFLSGFYIHGSIALGAFNERLSDIDFLTVCSHLCTEHDLECLQQIHQTIGTKYPRWALEGYYLQWNDLGKLDEALPPYPFYADDKLNPGGYHSLNSITWQLLKTHGLALIGPQSDTLPFVVDWDVLIDRMMNNLNTYWVSFTRDPRRMVWLLNNNGIQWAVLGVLRLFYTFKEHDITSKTGAGEYALNHVPIRWHPIVQEALNIREQKRKPLFKSRIVRALEAIKFLRYVIQNLQHEHEGSIVVRSGN